MGRPSHRSADSNRAAASGKERASGNVFYDSSTDLTTPLSPSTSPLSKPPLTWYSRGLLAVFIHPLELLAVKSIVTPSRYPHFLPSLCSLCSTPSRLFQGWRSTFLTAAFFRSPYLLGVPGVVRVRRMMEEGGTWDWRGSESLGRSLSVLREVVQEEGGIDTTVVF